CFSASYSSRPLVSGQTRISRSFGSTVWAGRSEDADMIASVTGQRRILAHIPAKWAPGRRQGYAPNGPFCLGGKSLSAAPSLQRRLALGRAPGELDLGDGDQDLGAGLEIGRLQHGLLLGRAIGRHHGERIDQRLVGRALDAVPVGLEVVRLEEGL